jgi:nicotinamidase/pyrazinamidase
LHVAFLDVDTQVDFVEPHGALPARGAERIKPNLARLVELARERRIPLVSTVDAHAPDDPEFAVFGPHCVRGTSGQRKLSETLAPGAAFVPSARSTDLPDPRERQVVLEKQVLSILGNANADAVLRATEATQFYVFGLVTEVCVKLAAEALIQRGYRVAIVEDAIAPLEAAAGERAFAELRAKGARTVRTADVGAELAAVEGVA